MLFVNAFGLSQSEDVSGFDDLIKSNSKRYPKMFIKASGFGIIEKFSIEGPFDSSPELRISEGFGGNLGFGNHWYLSKERQESFFE